MTVAEIKAEIAHLTFEEKAEIVQAIGLEYDAWDLQMLEDSRSGGWLRQLGEDALKADERGETISWP
jgi:hypothetical protein